MKVWVEAIGHKIFILKFQVVFEQHHFYQISMQVWILASTEAALRLDLNFWVLFFPIRLKGGPGEV